MLIEGMGCIGSFGSGPEELAKAWQAFSDNSGLADPGTLQGKGMQPKALPAADTSCLTEFFPVRSLRQTDHFTRMVLAAASYCLRDAGKENILPEDCGIILATGYGPASPTFAFLDSVLDFGEDMASPLAFSHSVQNIPAASLAIKLQGTGPCSTLCQLDAPISSGLLKAKSWLDARMVSRVLFVAADECTPFLADVTKRIVNERGEGALTRANSRRGMPLGEGAVAFLLARSDIATDVAAGSCPCSLEQVWLGREAHNPEEKTAGAAEQAAFALRGSAGAREEAYCETGCKAGHKIEDRAGTTKEVGQLWLSGPVLEGVPALTHGEQASHAYGNLPVSMAMDIALALFYQKHSQRSPSATLSAPSVCAEFSLSGLAGRLVLG